MTLALHPVLSFSSCGYKPFNDITTPQIYGEKIAAQNVTPQDDQEGNKIIEIKQLEFTDRN